MSDRELHDEQDYLNRGAKPVPVDEWTRETALTPDELAAYRKKMVELGDELGHSPWDYTCDRCSRAAICKLAFDGYNTDGDCLYSK